MQIVIDIPEDVYKQCILANSLFEVQLVNYIANGTPLDKIRAEIEELKLSFFDNKRTIDAVLSIIGKYRKEQE